MPDVQPVSSMTPLSQIEALIAEMRAVAVVAGQCSVEGEQDVAALMAASEADRLHEWADRLAALQVQPQQMPDELGPILSANEALRQEVARLTALVGTPAPSGPCYCCCGDRKPHAGHPNHCQPGCRCYGRCDDPACCEPDDALPAPPEGRTDRVCYQFGTLAECREPLKCTRPQCGYIAPEGRTR